MSHNLKICKNMQTKKNWIFQSMVIIIYYCTPETNTIIVTYSEISNL